jgi:hypothetical protein
MLQARFGGQAKPNQKFGYSKRFREEKSCLWQVLRPEIQPLLPKKMVQRNWPTKIMP